MTSLNEAMLEELKKAIDLQEYMRRFMDLKRSGDHYAGKCPFHSDSTPSFHVWMDHFHCFGCGKRGDVIEYEKHRTGGTFRDAVISLSEQYNMSVLVATEQDAQAAAIAAEKKRAIGILDATAEYYHELLMSHHGDDARKYLESRGFLSEQCKNWKLGLTLAYSVLEEFAKKNGWDLADVERAGLIATSQDGLRKYDFFRGRIIIPIRNERGRTIGFGGRIYRKEDVSNKQVPKFINPRETTVYSKSRVLFNFDRARAAILSTGEAIVVEGYMDALSLANAGIENVVAVSGTAMTSDHVKMLSNCARRVFLCFDADAAGQKAAERAFDIAYPMNLLELLFMRVSEGKDPDDFVRRHGAQGFKKLMSEAIPLIEKITLWCKPDGIGARDAWLRTVRKRVLPIVQKNPDAAQREIAFDVVTKILGLSSIHVLSDTSSAYGSKTQNFAIKKENFFDGEADASDLEKQVQAPRWSIESATEIKIVVALLCLSPNEELRASSDFDRFVRADKLFELCQKNELVSKESHEMVAHICALLRSSCVDIAPEGLSFAQYMEAPLPLQVMVALLKNDLGFVEDLGLKPWPISAAKKMLGIQNSSNALAIENAPYIAFCVQDTQLSQKRGSIVRYLSGLLHDSDLKCRRSQMLNPSTT